MASLDSLQTRQVLSRGVSQYAVTDSPVIFSMAYTGTGSVTSVTVTTATNIVTVTVESSGTVTKTYAFATYTTVGALVDAINNDGLFCVKTLDALRSDATNSSNIVTGAITATTDELGNTVWNAKADTSVNKALTVSLSPFRAFTFSKPLERAHRVHLQEVKYYITLGGAGANLVNFYVRRAIDKVETKIWTGTSVSATSTTISFASGFGKITANDGDQIICRVSDGTSITDAAANFLTATGYVE